MSQKLQLKTAFAALLHGTLCAAVLPAAAQTPTAAPAKIRVACVGDSITQGVFVDPSARWTAVLQADLGPRYDVENYGVSGTTLIKNGDAPYWKQPALAQAVAFQPNIVLIMLGTNDSKPQNLPAHPGEFAPDLKALIAQFTALPTHPKVWLVQPIPVVGSGLAGISEPVLAGTIRPAIRQVARQTKCRVIDLTTALAPHPEDSLDHVHPNPAGHKLIGDAVAAALQGKKANERRAKKRAASKKEEGECLPLLLVPLASGPAQAEHGLQDRRACILPATRSRF